MVENLNDVIIRGCFHQGVHLMGEFNCGYASRGSNITVYFFCEILSPVSAKKPTNRNIPPQSQVCKSKAINNAVQQGRYTAYGTEPARYFSGDADIAIGRKPFIYFILRRIRC
jgi:hypothetical protein